MSIVLGVLVLIILLWILPTVVGSSFSNVDKKSASLPFMWICGQMVLWAGFQLLCVPVILQERDFLYVVILFSVYILLWLVIATALYGYRRKQRRVRLGSEKTKVAGKWYRIAWTVFGALFLFQLFQTLVLAYADGDDAFYVAMSGMIENSGDMYLYSAYTGWPSGLDIRHGMAPFPAWIAYVVTLCGMKSVIINHIVMPLMLIPMTYTVYYLIGNKLFADKRERVPLFMIFIELLTLFGGYSLYTVESFMLARSRQGKAALGSVVIPVLFLLLLLLIEKIEKNQRIPIGFWILLAAATTTGCLCSTLGTAVVCILIGVVGLCIAIGYKRWKLLFPMATCCIPCVMYMGLYFLLG